MAVDAVRKLRRAGKRDLEDPSHAPVSGTPAAFLMAARMRGYVPQRQMLPSIAATICSREGLGFFCSSAAAVMSWPDWQ